jgi:hypothetical protein
MPRTDDAMVGAIIELDEDIDLTPFIDAANELVTEVCEPLYPAGTSETKLTRIETWLAAHFYTIRDPRKTMVAPTGLSVRYQSETDLGLNLSHYGQMALRLDTKGGLASLEQKAKKGGAAPQIIWLGTEYEDTELDEDVEE